MRLTAFLDSATARELGLTTTGHAQRGVSSAPSPGSSNLHLSPGPDTPEALMADITEGFYVTDLMGHKIASPAREAAIRRRLRTAFDGVEPRGEARARRKEPA